MFREVALECKLLATSCAGERFDVAVGLNMGPQVTLVCKGFVAQVAGEGFLSGVSPDVALEQPWSGE